MSAQCFNSINIFRSVYTVMCLIQLVDSLNKSAFDPKQFTVDILHSSYYIYKHTKTSEQLQSNSIIFAQFAMYLGKKIEGTRKFCMFRKWTGHVFLVISNTHLKCIESSCFTKDLHKTIWFLCIFYGIYMVIKLKIVFLLMVHMLTNRLYNKFKYIYIYICLAINLNVLVL